MGDLIQSTALFKKVKLIYPESHVKLLISKEFSEIGPFLPFVDEIKAVDITGLSEILKSVNFQFNHTVLEAVRSIFNGVLDVKYDLAVNLSHDEFSVYFLYILNSLKNVGISITREGSIISNDKMIAYMFSAVKNRKVSVLNLVDIYERTVGEKIKPHVNKIFLDTEKSILPLLLKERGVEEDDIVISFAIGASTELKKWRYDYFAGLAKMLIEKDWKIKIVLLGAGYDAEAGGFIEKIVGDARLINLTGKTSVSDLVSIVERSNLLITHDTGTMHIGVATGTKLIVIYTGNVGFLETGPYAEGNILVVPDIGCFPCDFNLKCLNPVCKDLIKPEFIFDMALMFVNTENGEDFSRKLSSFKDSGIIPTVSRFDSKNFIDFLPAVKGELKFKDLRLKILKLSLEHFYNGDYWKIDENEINVFLDCFESVEYNLSLDIAEELHVIESILALCEKGMFEAKKLAGAGLYNPFGMDAINEITGNIKTIDFELKHLSSVYDDISLFNQIHVINQNSSVSYDIFGLAVDSLKSYSDLKNQLKIFKKISLAFIEKINNYQVNI